MRKLIKKIALFFNREKITANEFVYTISICFFINCIIMFIISVIETEENSILIHINYFLKALFCLVGLYGAYIQKKRKNYIFEIKKITNKKTLIKDEHLIIRLKYLFHDDDIYIR